MSVIARQLGSACVVVLVALLSSSVVEADADRPPLVCPAGTSLVGGASPPASGMQRCEKPDGVKHGPSRTWKDGALTFEGEYRDGQPVGIWTHYGPKGHVGARGEIRNGKQQGVWTAYDDDGVKESETTQVDGVDDGPSVEFYPSGQKRMEGQNSKGVPVGHWVAWFESGKKRSEGDFKDGVFTNIVRYPENDPAYEQMEADRKRAEADKRSAYATAKADALKASTVAPLVPTTQKAVGALCTSMDEKWSMTRGFEQACPLKSLEQVGDLQVGSNERMCAVEVQSRYVKRFQDLDARIRVQQRALDAVRDDLAGLDDPSRQTFATFLKAGLDCYCPEASDGAPGGCSISDDNPKASPKSSGDGDLEEMCTLTWKLDILASLKNKDEQAVTMEKAFKKNRDEVRARLKKRKVTFDPKKCPK